MIRVGLCLGTVTLLAGAAAAQTTVPPELEHLRNPRISERPPETMPVVEAKEGVEAVLAHQAPSGLSARLSL